VPFQRPRGSGRERKSESFPNCKKCEAEAWLYGQGVDISRGECIDPQGTKITFQYGLVGSSDDRAVYTCGHGEPASPPRLPYIGKQPLSSFQPPPARAAGGRSSVSTISKQGLELRV
jgi:hypothetical protein